MTEQISILEEIDMRTQQTEKIELARIMGKLESEYVHSAELFGRNPDSLPDGLVVIERKTKYLQNGQKPVFYRCVIGHHKTVSGMMAHIISAPNNEWPEVPTWQYDNRYKCQWAYPDGEMWTRKEPEYDYTVKWQEE